jgi:hypothetical protein
MGAGRSTVALADLGDALEQAAGLEPVRGPDPGRNTRGRLDPREARNRAPAAPPRPKVRKPRVELEGRWTPATSSGAGDRPDGTCHDLWGCPKPALPDRWVCDRHAQELAERAARIRQANETRR